VLNHLQIYDNRYHLDSSFLMTSVSLQPLSSLRIGQTATVQSLDVDPGFLYRLNAMGIRIGKPLQLIRIAPFKGPLHLKMGNTEVMLRQQDAQNIQVSM
jgi:ferrous iron transport protein A